MGKRRNTAKTGDKAIYNKRGQDEDTGPKKDDADPMYDEIDQFHKDKDADYLKLDGGGNASDSEDDDGMTHQHNIMDLGAGGGDDDSASSSSSDDDDDEGRRVGQQAAHHKDDDDDSDSDEEASMVSSSDDDQDAITDPRQWGRKKSTYYHGDTADLEIGQDQEDAFLEEEAAKEVQKARLADMTEDDFVLSDNDEDQLQQEKETDAKDNKLQPVVEQDLAKTRDLSKFTRKDKRKLLQKQHSELLPIVSYFSDIIKDLKNKTSVAQKALFEQEGTAEAVGATAAGQEYLLTKTLLQSSMALNVAMYLLLKSEEQQQSSSPSEMDYMGPETTSAIPSHPVMARLEQWNSISLTLEDGVEEKVATLKEQMDNLVKAAALMQSEQGDDEDEASADDDESVDQEQTAGTDETKVSSSAPITPAESSQDEGDDDDAAQQEIGRNVLNEAKFGLRANEVAPSKKRTRRKVVFDDDFVGDGNDDDDEPNKSSFASTLNAIEQRSSTKSKKKQRADVEQLDNAEEDDDELRQGLKMMEEEMGRLDGNEDLGPMNMDDPDGDGGEIDDELEDGDDFYSKVAKKSKDKKAFKKSLYQVAPKYPRIDMEVEGERAISQTILKNRGLVPHKAKINRNPRVKKREQYRKAKIRRKGAVREVRTDEGHKYAGEQTGVKTGLSRSRKLIS